MYTVQTAPDLLRLMAIALYFCFALRLSIVDFYTRLLPDRLTLPLLWLGLLFHCITSPGMVDNAVYGATVGYLSLWLVFHLFRVLTGREGLGYGDMKLLAAIGAWNGWQSLPAIVMTASLLGMAFASIGMLVNKIRRDDIPFGPWLSVAGWGDFIWQGCG